MAKSNGGLTEAAKKLGHAGGLHGGPARAKALTASERSEIARKGAAITNRGKERKGKR